MTLYAGVTFLEGGATYTANQHPIQNVSERAPDQEDVFRRNNDKLSREIRCAIPAQVVSFDPTKQTITAQPLIRDRIINRQNGELAFIALPTLSDIPVSFPQAGNFVLTMPIQAGDEVLLIFSDMNIDSWWENGGLQNWNDRRRHDLSDAIAVVGLNSVPNVIPSIASNGTELRTKDGLTKLKITEDDILLDHEGKQIEITDSLIRLKISDTNKIEISSSGIAITGTLTINGKNFTLHTHAVTTAPGNTGGVNP